MLRLATHARPAALGAALLAAACGAPEEGAPFDDGSGGPGREPGLAEGRLRLAYPEPPYGTGQGAVIQDLTLLGWQDPAAREYDPATLAPLSLSAFHPPNGRAELRYLVVVSAAVWCTVCRAEFTEMGSRIDAYRERGIEFLGTLYEDNDGGPARPEDLSLWAERFDVRFPLVLDPAFVLGPYFDMSATPMNMVIDVRTMQILSIDHGWVPDGAEGNLWEYLDTLLSR